MVTNTMYRSSWRQAHSADAVRHKGVDSRCFDEKLAVCRIQNAQKYNAQCHITTRNTRSHIVACKCLLDMGIEKASGDGGATAYIYRCILKTGAKCV